MENEQIPLGYNMRPDNQCCNNNINYTNILKDIATKLCNISENINSIDTSDLGIIKRMLAYNNPMTVAAEYPHIEDDKFIVSTLIRFLDMLNSNMFVIFKIDNNSSNLPMYFRDSIYDHRIVFVDGTPVKPSDLQLNGLYKASYQYNGGYIIIESNVLNLDIITNY